jgi:hypothetical protein
MRKFNYLLAVLLVVGLLVGLLVEVRAGASGISDPTIAVKEFTPSGGSVFKDQVKSSLDSLATAVKASIDVLDAHATTLTANVARVDTNVTTTTTAYTPSKIGQILIGGAGEGTNGVWISKGVTTNDWVQVAPAVSAGE